MRRLPWLALVVLVAAPARAEQGVTDAELVLGASTSLSGPLAFEGEQASKFGVDLYFREVNAGGGIHGRKVRTVWYDDGYKPDAAVANTRKLVEQDRVFAVLAPLGTTPVAATLDYLEANAVPLLFPLQGSPITRGRRWVVNGTTLYDRQSRMMVDYLVGVRKFRKFGTLYQDDRYGTSFLALLEKDLARHGLTLVAAEAVKGSVDVGARMARLRAAKPEVLFLVLTPGPGAEALRERQKAGWTDVVLVSCGPLTDERYLALAGAAAEGVEGLSLWPDPLTSDRPGVERYREHMRKHFPTNQPNRHSLAGYAAAALFTEGASRAGPRLTRAGLMRALEGIREFDGGVLPPVTIGPDHEAHRQGLWVRVERGRFTALTGWLGGQ